MDRSLLTDAQVNDFLHGAPSWRRQDKEIVRTFHFDAFLKGIEFVSKVAKIAEKHDHHPDIDIRYRDVTLKLTTHDAGGLTGFDTQLAKEIDALV